MVTGINPYITTDGNGREAVKFYQQAIEAELVSMQTFGEMPANPEFPIPPEAKDRVLHAHMKIGGNDLMLSDTFPGQPYQPGDQISIAIHVSNPERANTVFDKLQDGGKVTMPLQETFWSPAYGQVTDKFGITWQVSTQSNE